MQKKPNIISRNANLKRSNWLKKKPETPPLLAVSIGELPKKYYMAIDHASDVTNIAVADNANNLIPFGQSFPFAQFVIGTNLDASDLPPGSILMGNNIYGVRGNHVASFSYEDIRRLSPANNDMIIGSPVYASGRTDPDGTSTPEHIIGYVVSVHVDYTPDGNITMADVSMRNNYIQI